MKAESTSPSRGLRLLRLPRETGGEIRQQAVIRPGDQYGREQRPRYLDTALYDVNAPPETELEELSARDSSWINRVQREFESGFRLMADRGPCVTVFGSARVRPFSPMYRVGCPVARELAERVLLS